MHHYFYAIHLFVNRRKSLSVALAVAMLFLFGFFASQIKFEEDITKLIPTNDKSDATAKVLKQLNFADKITVIFHLEKKGTAEDLKEMATAFSDSVALSCKPYVTGIQGKVDEENIQETIDFVYNNLPLFLDNKDYAAIQEKLQKDSIAATVQSNYKSIISPSGFITKDFILQDPLRISFIALKKLQQLNLGDDFTLDNGFVMTKDKKKLLLFITSNIPSSETEKNTLFAAKLASIQNNLNQQFKTKTSISYFGSALIAVANANQIKSDIILTTTIAMVTLMLILILFYRKIYIPLIIFLPTVFGALFAIAFLYFVKEKISAISLGIGSILLGITIDYSIHILTHYKHNSDVKTLYKDITMPLIMSSSTTAVAFLCLLFVKSEALNDLGIFAAVIVMASAFFSLLIVPHLYHPKDNTTEHKKNIIDKLAHFSFHNNKFLIGFCVLITIICCFTYNNVGFNNDLSQLNFIPKDIKAAEKELEESSSLTSKTIYLASYGNTMEEVLQNNTKLFEALAKEKQQQKILSYSSVGGIMLSQKEQQQKIAKWNSFWDGSKKQLLQSQLIAEGAKLGFKPTTYTTFFDHLNTDFKTISTEEYLKIQALQLHEFVTQKDGFFTISTLVKVTPKQRDAFVKSAEAKTKLIAIDRQQMNETFFSNLKTDFNSLVNYSFIAVILILFFFFRRVELVIVSCIPIALTGIVTAGIMGIFGIQMNIFSMIVCTLIFGHGVDFSIFMTSALQKEYTNGKNEIAIYRTSIILAVITTILGIGAMIFAEHPALRSISAVSLIGVFAALIITFIFYPILFKLFLSNRPKNGKAPFQLRSFVHGVISFFYYGMGGILMSVFSLTIMRILPFSEKAKMKGFRYFISKFMKSVLYSNPFLRKKIINTHNETFDKPAILIANHSSFLDILAVGMLSPKIIFLVSDWVYNSPIFGATVRKAGFYPVSEGIEGGIEHLRKKVEEGYSLMVFPEGTRSENNTIKRFHKGAFFLAEQFNLDIIPIVIHGASEAIPKGDFVIYDSTITVSILDKITPENDTFGKNYTERTKQLSTFFKAQHSRIRQELEGPDYFKKMLINSYDYKETEIIKSVKSNLNANLATYYHLNKYLSAKAKILHLANDYGQLDLLLTLQEPLRKIDSYAFDAEKVAVAKTNYIVRKRKISYFENLESILKNQYDAVLISDEEYKKDLEKVIATTSCVLLVNSSSLKSTLLTLDFAIISEENQIIVLKKK
ncbi:1-acyl-sn-glycerol-3-phosphate acyltransferase [Flavobacterium sp. Fl-77]|uniref:1-acyl-sn-glycerol-3-phosphate acyltransferase n=1 Tax=Flavobacterium flavipigmentatum TaxID=2893884 RepID=A0AAJ2SE21_9FLAO|nr:MULTISPECIES: 1-acyl-sn-glycerol-3-phosphate acyltransferase [unclassified Flavobacterium]MDX6181028.1 1-acyl-sn-glycerol-3-phosphate acyltransferase [Flavobacterium sp. Fl-33]MDX6184629.1 1-acyl-sn-glycerol-3-phosphate acyltransferase [Flavobacterium sp. Fl-77]UFH39731.1 1-acyl-sn-glycerol-3-phosphate acyltransferase [Flavobacterium sp. F-70]